MKSKNMIHAAALAVLLAAATAQAADAETKAKGEGANRPAGVATFGQLDELRSQNAMLEASIKNADLKSKLVGGKAAPGPGPSIPLSASQAPTPAMSDAAAASLASTAEITMVASDADGRLVAVLALPNGRKVKARVGMDIAGLGVIKSISIDEVVAVGKKGKLITLPFASDPTTNIGMGAPTGPVLIPGPMPGAMPGLSTVMPPIPRGGRQQ